MNRATSQARGGGGAGPGAYVTAPIAPAQVDTAYLLVRPLAPLLDISHWRAYCEPAPRHGATGRKHGIVVALNARGYVLGLCVHAIAGHPVHGAILDVPVFVVASAADETGVADALVRDLRATAARLGCTAVRIATEGSPRLHRDLQDSHASISDTSIALILETGAASNVPWAPPQADGLPVKT